ncbi:hypothetical protein DsansV1_C03g0029061 [Dioscorea sansibarensis]
MLEEWTCMTSSLATDSATFSSQVLSNEDVRRSSEFGRTYLGRITGCRKLVDATRNRGTGSCPQFSQSLKFSCSLAT